MVARNHPNERRHPEIEVHVGQQIKLRRMLLGITQAQLASMIGVSFQQLHLFERGQSHLYASRLYEIAKALNIPIEFFFQGLKGGRSGTAALGVSAAPALADAGLQEDGRSQREIRAIIQSYRTLTDAADRQKLLDWVIDLSPDPEVRSPWIDGFFTRA